ncbi:MAG: ATP-binding protein, partial [Bdellovibrionia bacterium]
GDVKVYLKGYGRLLSSLVHAFRNAVDHGIEFSEKRLEDGKPEAGEIRVSFKVYPNLGLDAVPHLQIQIKDDGNGINADRIREKLKATSARHPLLNAEDTEVYQTLFESGFSTKTEVTELSGRGVGLDAILCEAQRLNGNARLDSEFGRGTTLTIEVPLISVLELSLEDA